MVGTGRLWLLALLAVGVSAWYGSASTAQLNSPGVSAGRAGIVSHVISQDGRPPSVVVTDPASSVLAVYQIDPATGALKLKSVRNVTWDLKMTQYNSKDPSPEDVRAGLPPR